MEGIIVIKSPDINQTDTIKYLGNKTVFSLDDKNNTDGSLILIYMYCCLNSKRMESKLA